MSKSSDINAGIYLVSCKETGGSYIGASADLTTRLYQHQQHIKNRSGNDRYLAAFPRKEKFTIDQFPVGPPEGS